jgi:hypothetical protein
MSDTKNPKPIIVTFDQIQANANDRVEFSEVEALLNQISQQAADEARLSPNQLVRVVHNQEILWMTQKQALDFLQNQTESDLQKDVELALKSDLKFIRRELEIWICLAQHILESLKEDESLSQEEITQIEQSLQRRKKELQNGVLHTTESEAMVANKRKKTPILDEYETIMGQFLNAKDQGDQEKAATYAKILNENKKMYLLLSRALEPDLQTINYYRLNLQKTKRRIINTHQELCASRTNNVNLEIQRILEELQVISKETKAAEQEGLNQAHAEIKKQDIRTLFKSRKHLEINLDYKEKELQSLTVESSILQKQEQQTGQVIQHITENILKGYDPKVDIGEIKSITRISTPPKPASAGKDKISRMFINERLKH